MSYIYKYPRPAVTADSVVFTWSAGKIAVLLIARKNPPYRGAWALPGGFMEMDETAEACALRELKEETGLQVPFLRQIGAFSAVDRDPRERTVTVAFYTFVDKQGIPVMAGDDADCVAWFALNDLPVLAFDHHEIIAVAADRFDEEIRKTAEEGKCLFPDLTSTNTGRIQECLMRYRYSRRMKDDDPDRRDYLRCSD